MPSLMNALRDTTPEGYAPAPDKPSLPAAVVLPGKAGNFTPNPSIRCPLPPFNIGPDTLRQFDQSEGTAPKRRVIPLPIQSQVGGGGTTINNTTVTGGSSSSGSTTSLTAKTVTYTSPIINPGEFNSQVLTMAKSYQLISVTANSPCEMRLYGSLNSMAADAGRPTDSPVPAELFNNMVTDLIFDTSPFTWEWQNRVGVNTDTPQDTQSFITVFNTGTSPTSIQLTIVFLPLES